MPIMSIVSPPRRYLLAGLLVLTVQLLLFAAILFPDFAIGIPGEWVWQKYHRGIPWIDGLVILTGFIIAALPAWLCDFRLRQRGGKLGLCLLILALGSWFDYNMLLVGEASVFEAVLAVGNPHTGGYLEAAARMPDPLPQTLRNFHHRLAADADPANHLDVHPPGNIVFSWLARRCPLPVPLRDWMFDAEMRDLCRRNFTIPEQLYMRTAEDFHDGETIVILFWLLSAAARLLIFAALWRVWRHDVRHCGLVALLLAAGLGGQILFLGHFDVLYFFGGALCLWLLVCSLESARGGVWWSLALGVSLGVCTTLTLAFGVLIAGSLLLYGWRLPLPQARRQGGALLAGGLLVVALLELAGIRIISICLLAARNNARFFAEAGRHSFWLPWNLLDLLIFEGVLFVLPMFLGWPARARDWLPLGRGSQEGAWLAAWGLALLFLLVSPFSRGEMGRLYLFILPVLAFLSCRQLSRMPAGKTGWLLWGGLALLAAWFNFTTRVNLKLVLFY